MPPDRDSNADEGIGYDTDVDPGAVDAGTHFGSDAADARRWRDLGSALTSAETVPDLLRTIEAYGWAPPLLGLALHGIVRGAFEYLADPFVMSEGYRFPGWQLALGINLFYGFFIVLFAWFLYFGLIGTFAGYLSSEKAMDTIVFKAGGYLSALFAPVFVVGSILVLTIPAPDATAIGGIESIDAVSGAYTGIYDTLQMRIVGILTAAGWIVVGFCMLPVVAERFDLDERRSVIAVLPVTLVAVVSTQLL